jgi:hypothetical protein
VHTLDEGVRGDFGSSSLCRHYFGRCSPRCCSSHGW